MRTLVCLLLAFAGPGWAAETADRSAIERVIAALNETFLEANASARAQLYTADADVGEIAALRSLSQPWSEASTPKFVTRRMRFVTPDVALVDAAVRQFGSVMLVNRSYWLLVFRKDGAEWRIASARLLGGPIARLGQVEQAW